MENSIEEDIKNIEEIIELSKEEIDAKAEDIIAILDIEDLISLEHILQDYERVLKENEEWDRKFCNLQNLYFKLQDESESKRKEYQETYKDVREELRELRKENEEYSKQLDLDYVDNNYIPKQKIKDKIEEINKMIAYEHNDAVIIQLGKQKRVLQKLLESEE